MSDKRQRHIDWCQQILRDAGYCSDGSKCAHACRVAQQPCVRKSFGVTPLPESQLNNDWELEEDPAIVTVSWPAVERRQQPEGDLKMIQPTKLTFDEWTAQYQPGERIDNLHDPAVSNANVLTVWTELECDGKTIITNGYRYVNREAYYLCAVPFIHGTLIEVADPFEDDEKELDDAAERDEGYGGGHEG